MAQYPVTLLGSEVASAGDLRSRLHEHARWAPSRPWHSSPADAWLEDMDRDPALQAAVCEVAVDLAATATAPDLLDFLLDVGGRCGDAFLAVLVTRLEGAGPPLPDAPPPLGGRSARERAFEATLYASDPGLLRRLDRLRDAEGRLADQLQAKLLNPDDTVVALLGRVAAAGRLDHHAAEAAGMVIADDFPDQLEHAAKGLSGRNLDAFVAGVEAVDAGQAAALRAALGL